MAKVNNGSSVKTRTSKALHRLALGHQSQPPIVLVVDSLGEKSSVFSYLAGQEKWSAFLQDAGADCQADAFIYPALANAGQDLGTQVREIQNRTAKAMGFCDPQEPFVDATIWHQPQFHEGQWRERWLDAFAWSAGFHPQTAGAARGLAAHLTDRRQRIVFLVDGLDELFSDLEKVAQQTPLRALLQDVPEWLALQPGLPLGIVIFVDRRLVPAAVRYNAAQLMARYDPYSLR